MNCLDQQQQISIFLDGDLSLIKQSELHKHLAECSNCCLFLNTMLKMKETIKKEQILFPDELDDRVFSELAKQKRTEKQIATKRQARLTFWQRPIIIPMPITVGLSVLVLSLAVMVTMFVRFQYQLDNTLKTFFSSEPQKVVLSYELPEIEVWGHVYQKSSYENDGQIQESKAAENKDANRPDSSQLIISISTIDEPPQFLNLVEPDYPLLAQKYGIGGKVMIKALVDNTGRLEKVGLLKSDFNFPSIVQSAFEAIRQTQFSPAKRNGTPISAWIIVTYSFRTDSNQFLKKFYEYYI